MIRPAISGRIRDRGGRLTIAIIFGSDLATWQLVVVSFWSGGCQKDGVRFSSTSAQVCRLKKNTISFLMRNINK